jgi:transcriptional regulator of acetoin/glycerol metabolism
MFGNEYKKASTSTGWNISKLAKELRLSRTTVTKYIKEYEENKD